MAHNSPNMNRISKFYAILVVVIAYSLLVTLKINESTRYMLASSVAMMRVAKIAGQLILAALGGGAE